jgi:lytic murein transglycosylase
LICLVPRPLAALVAGGLLLAASAFAAPAGAAPCGGDFDAFLKAFSGEAATQGVSPKTLTAALSGLASDPKVLALDRNQKPFKLTFEEFSKQRISAGRIKKGALLLLQHASMLSRIEQEYGVAPEVLVALWGLETDYGVNQGKQPSIRALATLAHDCRRTDMFQAELLAALQIVDHGDLSAADMRGAWAGEIGQTQFLPTSYVKYAVDFDGSGKRDLIHSVPDVLASTANYLKGYGWKPGPYTEGTANFEALKGWNKSSIYQKTIALFAQRLSEAQ